MEKFNESHYNDIINGIHLFNDKKYWECHEELEHYWLEYKHDNIRYIFWSIIQVAAALVHYRENNLSGCESLLMKAKQKIVKVKQLNIDTSYLESKVSWSSFIETLNAPQNDDYYQNIYNYTFVFIEQ